MKPCYTWPRFGEWAWFFCPQVMIHNDLLENRLEIVLPDHHLGNAQLCGVYQSRSYLSSKVRTFLDFVGADPRMTFRHAIARWTPPLT